MLLQSIISFLARKIYKKDHQLLIVNLIKVADKVESINHYQNSVLLENLLILGEDHRFKYHFGFDMIGMLRAVKKRIFLNKIEGASTIEQQLVRVLINDYEPTIYRKIKEIFLATTLQEVVPRKRIPLIYLCVAYYGPNIFGYQDLLRKLQINNEVILTEEIATEVIARIKYPDAKKKKKKRSRQIQKRKLHLMFLYKQEKMKKNLQID